MPDTNILRRVLIESVKGAVSLMVLGMHHYVLDPILKYLPNLLARQRAIEIGVPLDKDELGVGQALEVPVDSKS